MDCITCHNRITHLVAMPEDTVDKLIATGLISSDIPEVRRQAVALYSEIFDTTEMGKKISRDWMDIIRPITLSIMLQTRKKLARPSTHYRKPIQTAYTPNRTRIGTRTRTILGIKIRLAVFAAMTESTSTARIRLFAWNAICVTAFQRWPALMS